MHPIEGMIIPAKHFGSYLRRCIQMVRIVGTRSIFRNRIPTSLRERTVHPFSGSQDDTSGFGTAGSLEDSQRTVCRNVIGIQGTIVKTIDVRFGCKVIYNISLLHYLNRPINVPDVPTHKFTGLAIPRHLQIVDHDVMALFQQHIYNMGSDKARSTRDYNFHVSLSA